MPDRAPSKPAPMSPTPNPNPDRAATAGAVDLYVAMESTLSLGYTVPAFIMKNTLVPTVHVGTAAYVSLASKLTIAAAVSAA